MDKFKSKVKNILDKLNESSDMRVKYPRTYHMPFSEALAADDKFVDNPDMFDGMNVVVTLKMDGENTSLYNSCIHARSLDSKNHPSRDWVKSWHSGFAHDIPDDMRICGENLYAKHSVEYKDLSSYFYGFSIWIGDKCLDWKSTLEWFQLFDITPVEQIYSGVYDENKILNSYKKYKSDHEGFVIRNSGSFKYDDFSKNVAKFVRKNHVQTDDHWMHSEIVPNKLKK